MGILAAIHVPRGGHLTVECVHIGRLRMNCQIGLMTRAQRLPCRLLLLISMLTLRSIVLLLPNSELFCSHCLSLCVLPTIDLTFDALIIAMLQLRLSKTLWRIKEITVGLLAFTRLNVADLLLLKPLVLVLRGRLIAESIIVTGSVTRRRFNAAIVAVAT